MRSKLEIIIVFQFGKSTLQSQEVEALESQEFSSTMKQLCLSLACVWQISAWMSAIESNKLIEK